MIKSWSFTKLEHYLACPRRFLLEDVRHTCPFCFKGEMIGWEAAKCDKCGRVAQTPEALARGIRLHAAAEAYLLRKSKITAELKHALIPLKYARAQMDKGVGRVEYPFVTDAEWRPVDKYTKGAWFRGKGDFVGLGPDGYAEVIDWKSGGVNKKTNTPYENESNKEQIELYALMVLLHFPAVSRIRGRLVYLDCPTGDGERPANEVHGAEVVRKDEHKLINKWTRKIRPMFNDDVCAPAPSGKCRFCPFAKALGGPCPY